MRRKRKTITDIEALKAFLKSQKLKATPQRLMVHEAMMELGHASADMVAEHIASNCGTSITIASVYNVLSMMADLKIYSRRMSSNNKMYFDVNSFRHIHIYDTVNNSYRDLIDDELLSLVEERLKDRQPKGYRLEEIVAAEKAALGSTVPCASGPEGFQAVRGISRLSSSRPCIRAFPFRGPVARR